ncbi:MAG: hypothetical protein FWB72_00635 [Firmicutes bacterium]|nr:hypothetical protein [Bacillota bacterium]
MQILHYKQKYNKPIVLALGFFDSLHIGHLEIIQQTIKKAQKHNARPALFTFSNNPSAVLSTLGVVGGASKKAPNNKAPVQNQPYKLVNTFNERIAILKKMGLEVIIAAEFSKELLTTTRECFLKNLLQNFNIVGLVCGTDFKFGLKGLGNCEFLQEQLGELVSVVNLVKYGDKKASSSCIRDYLIAGDIQSVNAKLICKYSISGQVVKGYSIGRELGFPTANIVPCFDKHVIKQGVYATSTRIGDSDQTYLSISNVGGRPTFNDKEQKIETYLLDYKGAELYGKNITITFLQRLRDVQSFDSKSSLAVQIEKDIKKVLELDKNI